MNHPIQPPQSPSPLEIQLNLPNDKDNHAHWKVLAPPTDPAQFQKVQVPLQDVSSQEQPLRIPIRIAEKDGHNAGDYQVVLQILPTTESDTAEDETAQLQLLNNAASFDHGSCDGQRRIAGRAMDEFVLEYKQPSHPIRLVAAWAAGHEPVKLLQGMEFGMMTMEMKTSTSDTTDIHHAGDAVPEDRHAEAVAESHEDVEHDENNNNNNQQPAPLHWADDTNLLQSICATSLSAKTLLADNALPPSMHLWKPLEPPVALEIAQERDEETHTTLEITTSVEGPILFHVQTIRKAGTSKPLALAHWQSHRALCEDKQLILVHTREELPVVLRVPVNPGQVEIHITAIYADKDHDNAHSHVVVHPTAPLELHWSTEEEEDTNKHNHNHNDNHNHDHPEDNVASLNQHNHPPEPKQEPVVSSEDPQRELDRKISQDLRAHLEEMKQKTNHNKDSDRHDHGVFMQEAAKRKHSAEHEVRDRQHQEAQKAAAQTHAELSAQARKARREAERLDPTTTDLLPPRHHHKYHNLWDSNDLEAQELPMVTWQDSRYFMGLMILVGGIYGSIVVCTILSQFLQAKGRNE